MKIGIIGLGLIGGTIAKSLNQKHFISAYDIDHSALEYAIENNIIHQAYKDLKQFLEDNNLVYLCLYPKMIIDFFKDNRNLINPNTLFIEISGVKTSLISKIQKFQISNFDIVYTHPIAGRELIGIKYSNENIFFQGNYVIIDHSQNKKKSVDLAYDLAKEMGFKNISIISAKLHDELIAYTSQLTHIISLTLVSSFHQEVNLSHFTGDSYRDLTRISNINTNLWSDLFFQNQDYLCEKITDFQNNLEQFKTAIVENDKTKLEKLMNEAKILHSQYLENQKNES